jgi:hypothetical protein
VCRHIPAQPWNQAVESGLRMEHCDLSPGSRSRLQPGDFLAPGSLSGLGGKCASGLRGWTCTSADSQGSSKGQVELRDRHWRPSCREPSTRGSPFVGGPQSGFRRRSGEVCPSGRLITAPRHRLQPAETCCPVSCRAPCARSGLNSPGPAPGILFVDACRGAGSVSGLKAELPRRQESGFQT